MKLPLENEPTTNQCNVPTQCNVQKTLEFLNRSICSGSLKTLFKNETACLASQSWALYTYDVIVQ